MAEGGISLVAHDSARALPPRDVAITSGMLRCVSIDDMERRLQECSAKQVLMELSSRDDLICSMPAEVARCGLISYRQEWKVDGDFDHLTLDGSAFTAVLAAAKSIGLKALWLDAWCYRFTGDYNHADFCSTLHDVITKVEAVVWLPLTRVDSKGEYPYRLWCTFEAACVLHRGLPVVIAGKGLSSFQRRIFRFGSFTPALWADGTLDQLCRINLFFYLSFVGNLYFILWTPMMPNPVSGAVGMFFIGTVYLPLVWLTCRMTVGRQVRLARNARSVLHVMTAAAGRKKDPFLSLSKPPGLESILQQLPWLPAHDRRDTLVVQHLLGLLRPDLKLSTQGVYSLAFSAYHAARLSPSSGDQVACSVSCAMWLKEKDIRVDRVSYGDSLSIKSVRVLSTEAADEDARPDSWLHGRTATGAIPSTEDCLHMDVLRGYGWVAVPGISSALSCPLGAIAVPSPLTDSTCRRWVIGNATVFPRVHLGISGAVFLANSVLTPIITGTTIVLYRHFRVLTSERYYVLMIAFQWVNTGIVAVLQSSVLRADWASVRQCRMPIPFITFNSWYAMLAITLMMVLLSGVNALYIHLSLPLLDVNISAPSRTLELAYAYSNLVLNFQQSALILEVALPLIVFLVASQVRRRCWDASTANVGDVIE